MGVAKGIDKDRACVGAHRPGAGVRIAHALNDLTFAIGRVDLERRVASRQFETDVGADLAPPGLRFEVLAAGLAGRRRMLVFAADQDRLAAPEPLGSERLTGAPSARRLAWPPRLAGVGVGRGRRRLVGGPSRLTLLSSFFAAIQVVARRRARTGSSLRTDA